MRAVIQRVKEARVTVGTETTGQIKSGLLIFLGVAETDNDEDFQYLLKKTSNLRIFSDPQGRMNLSVIDVKGQILLISQFTLLADTRSGNRPSFTKAAKPELAEPIYRRFGSELERFHIPVQWGVFGADMQVSLCNDGPVTIILDSRERAY